VSRITGSHWQTGTGIAIEVSEGRIVGVHSCADAEPGVLAPALVDLQVNGWAGLDLNDGTLSAGRIVRLCHTLATFGIGGLLPTLITAAPAALLDALSAIRAACEDDALARRMIAGVHVEGPAISPEDGPRGAHPLEHVRPLTLEEVAAWQRASGGLVKMITLSPEWRGSEALIRGLAHQGILVAIGHTAASAEQVHGAAAAGARVSTHLGNGAAAMLPRHPNHIWAQLGDDRLVATFIADGHHLPADTFRAMLRAKGLERSVLVSDIVAHGGLPAGRYASPIGGDVEVSEDGRISMAGTPYLAGAGVPLISCLGRAMKMAGLALGEALPLVTTGPARLVGRSAVLDPGAPADIVRLRDGAGGPELAGTWLGGERVA
jgi:N-acetylglucosamine-6-phosphate deacetylase